MPATTDDQASDASSEDTLILEEADLQHAIQELVASEADLQDMPSKKFLRLVARKLGVSMDDLAPYKSVCKKCLAQELAKQEVQMPSEQEIQAAAQKLAKRVDLETTTFKKFTRLLCDDLSLEDLSPAKPILRQAYDDAVAEQEAQTETDREESSFPSDKKIVKSCKKLAASSKIDLQGISSAKFLRKLEKRLGDIDLSTKKDLVYTTLKKCKSAQLGDVGTTKCDESTSIYTESVTATTTTATDDLPPVKFVSRDFDVENQEPEKFSDKPRASAECKQGFRIPEAKDLKWTDEYFDDDVEDLVAVFDHDYKMLFRFFIKVAILTNLLPIAIFMWSFIILFFKVASNKQAEADACSPYDIYSYDSSCETYANAASAWRRISTFLIVIDLIYTAIAFYGWYRIIKKRIFAMHVAVMRDGARLVLDDHLRGRPFLAGLHIFDTCLLISRQEEMIPFDQVVNFRTKAAGEVIQDIGWCCFWCCGCCLKIPFETIEMKTSCDTPTFAEGTMWGLFEPKRLEKLVWGMKRDKGEQIHRDANKQRQEQAARAEEQRAWDSERRALESQAMLQMMSSMMQQNQQMNRGPIATAPKSASESRTRASRPPPPPPTR